MSKSHLALVFEGSAVDNGEIDVQDLAPALLAMGNLIQSVNDEINGERATMQVRVKATSQGSFIVALALDQSLIESTKMLFDTLAHNKDGIEAANGLVELILKTGGGFGGLFALIKWLKGRKPEKIESNGKEARVYINGDVFVTSPKVIRLMENVDVRDTAKKAISILTKEGIHAMKFRRDGEDDLEIAKSEVGFFEYEYTELELSETTRTLVLQIVSLSFKEDNKWRFTDGRDNFTVSIEDVDFLNKIEKNEVSFSKGDYLRCEIRERQVISTKGTLKTECTVLKVLEHIPAGRQLRLL